MLILYYKTFLTSLYVIKSCLAKQNVNLNYTRGTGVHSVPISAIFCKSQIDSGSLAEGEDPKKLEESLNKITQQLTSSGKAPS